MHDDVSMIRPSSVVTNILLGLFIRHIYDTCCKLLIIIRYQIPLQNTKYGQTRVTCTIEKLSEVAKDVTWLRL